MDLGDQRAGGNLLLQSGPDRFGYNYFARRYLSQEYSQFGSRKCVRASDRFLLPSLISRRIDHLLHAQLASETLCTENLTPFLKLLPCKGISGISGLMKPYVLLAHDWHAMGVDYTSSEDDSETDLVLWWEAVVNLVDWEKDAKRGECSDMTNVGGRLNGISFRLFGSFAV